MTVKWETIEVDGKPMRLYVGAPDRPGPHPGIVVIQHAGGLDAFVQDTVHRLHREGYVAVAPELFHRQPTTAMEPVQRTQLLKDDEILADVAATIAFMKPTAGPIGIVGFCMGGRVTYLVAGSNKDVSAAAVFYGGNIMRALGTGPSPFERTANINCPVIGFFGVEDQNPSPADVAKIDAELTRLGKWHEFHSYQGAGHAFENFLAPERYRERPARAAWHEMLAFFTERLKQP
jgi:carboxymethylenebutenolidase